MGETRISAAYAVWLMDFLQSTNEVAPAALLAEARLDPAALEPQGATITAAQHHRLLLAAKRLSGNPSLGLRLGAGRNFATFDRYGHALLSSATLRQAIALGVRYQGYPGRFSGRALILSFFSEGGRGVFQLDEAEDLGELRLLAVEEVLGNLLVQTERVLGKPLALEELTLAYPQPAHAGAYGEVFACPIHFGAAPTRLIFNGSVLDQPLPQASAGSAALYARDCADTLAQMDGGDLVRRVRALVTARPACPPSLPATADELAMSSRTLRRRLSALGWSYQRLVDQSRHELAQRYLRDQGMNIARVSERLGFSEPSSFHRAFRRWAGCSPSAYRGRC